MTHSEKANTDSLVFPDLNAPMIEKKYPPKDYNKIGVIHFKNFKSDGISLESRMIGNYLEQSGGKKVYYIGEDTPEGSEMGLKIPDLSYQDEWQVNLRNRLYKPGTNLEDEEALLYEIEAKANHIKRQLLEYVDASGIGILHIRNLMGMPLNIPASKALMSIMEERKDLRFVIHTADFIWEGRSEKYAVEKYPTVQNLITNMFPPVIHDARVKYIVINSLAQKKLREDYGIESEIISDSYDFNRPLPQNPDEIREKLGFQDDDIVIGQMTRCIPRKTIERTIQLARKMQDLINAGFLDKAFGGNEHLKTYKGRKITRKSKVKIYFGQSEDRKEHEEYYDNLKAYADSLGIDIVEGDGIVEDAKQAVSKENYFYDTYSAVDIFSYPSQIEGFGNQLLEGIWAELIPVVFEYDVFESDIKDHNLWYVPFGNKNDINEKTPYDQDGRYLSQIKDNKMEEAAREVLGALARGDNTEVIEKLKNNKRHARNLWDVKKNGVKIKKIFDDLAEYHD